MKKLLFILIFVFFPIIINASIIEIPETDVSIELNDNWIIYNRNNLEQNINTYKLDISLEELKEKFEKNNLYLHAFYSVNDDNKLLLLRYIKNEEINNLSNYNEGYIKLFAKKYAENQGQKEFRLYTTKYKYFVVDSMEDEFYIKDYYTVVNAKTYAFTFKSDKELNNDVCDNIIKSVSFKIDPKLKKENRSLFLFPIIGVFIGLVIGGIYCFITLKNNIKNNDKKSKNKK